MTVANPPKERTHGDEARTHHFFHRGDGLHRRDTFWSFIAKDATGTAKGFKMTHDVDGFFLDGAPSTDESLQDLG